MSPAPVGAGTGESGEARAGITRGTAGVLVSAVWRVRERGVKRAVIAIVAAILGAGIFTKVLLELRPHAELWDWFITFVATILTALFAIGVFEYQSRRTERDRQDQLLEGFAAELQSNLDILRHEHRTPFISQGPKPGSYVKYAEAKLVPMEPIAGDAAIRSGVFDAEDVYLVTRIVRDMHVHNSEVAYLSATRLNTAAQHSDAIIFATKELDQRQERIATMGEELLAFLREHGGIEVPTRPGRSR